MRAAAAAATIGTPARRERRQRERDRAAAERGHDRRAAPELRREQGEEEGRERGVEAEPGQVTERRSTDDPDRRPR